VVSHESLYDYTCTFKDHFNLNAEDVVLQQSSFSFDTSVEEIFPILSAGGTLAIEENPKDFHEVLATCEREKVTLLSTSPFVVQYLNEHFDQYRLNLRVVISGGDVLKSDHISRLWRRYEVYNTYGPTESTVCALYHHVTSDEKPVPIGRPITNRQVFLMNGNSLLPQGAIGEIVLGGKGVAIRYHGRPEQTSRSFTTINEERVYRTGDLGKWNERGELVFLGRRDRQLNFLGHRIEAREVEEALKSIDKSISNCHLAMKEVAQRVVLVAYLIADAKEQEHYLIPLAKKLPSIMIPQHIVVLNEFPTLASGKIDEDALPAASIKKSPAAQTLPTTSEQLTVANIWQKLLGLDEVDIHTNFFELGGHSLLANQYVSHIREICAIEITLRDFYEQPTIAKQAELLSLGSSSPRLVLKQAPQQDYYPLSFSQERLWFLHHLNQSNKS
ncbi:MAG: AMP-binding protein, partial [Pseudomonadales bacterium]